jgi:EAL domain-containing protein (putative c-di-GMP-specific phosphodiesterase class I)/GGDEF domain-containing protein
MARNADHDNIARDSSESLAHTIRNRLVSSVFQPIVDLHSGLVAGYEALCRPHPDSNFRNAEEMFTAAEGDALGWQLEELARGCALEAAAGWPRGMMLFLNSSPEIVSDPRFARQVAREVRMTRGISPSRVVLEITERCKDREFEGLSRTIDALRRGGFHIAIDDVGAGTSGLNRITSLKPGWLKLDRELVDGIDRDKVRQHLIRFLVCFGKLSSIRVVAEGIERIEELDTLIDLGVHYGQGYLLAKPNAARQDIAADLRQHIRDKAHTAFPATNGALESTRAGSLVRSAEVVDSGETVSGVAALMLRDLFQPGVVVTDGGRFDGWVDRDVILRAASDGRAALPISFLLGGNRSTVETTMPIIEMLDLASTRDEHSMASPIVVLDGERILGIVTMADLLQAGASLCRATQFRYAPLTGLPGRVRTDLHLNDLLGADAAETPMDAAFIDIKGFAEYNRAYGYELGDQLIQEFVAVIRAALARALSTGECFLGHLGDDHFIVTAPAGMLGPRIETLASEFEALHPEARHRLLGLGARIMLLERIRGCCRDTRDLFRARSRIRVELDRGGRLEREGPSDLILRPAARVLEKPRERYGRKSA